MKQPVKMPALSDTMQTGRLVRWLKQPGDAVAPGDVLAEVETDKAVMEMEAFAAGVLAGPLAAEDQDYAVGATLGWIGDTEADQPEPERQRGAARPAAGETERGTAAPASPAPERAAGAPALNPPQRTEPDRPREPAPPPAGEAQGAAVAAAAPVRPRPAAVNAHAPGPAAAPEISPVLAQALAGRGTASRPADDADAALRRELAAGPPYTLAPPARLRQVIAATVSQAVRTPQFRVSARIDLAPLKAHADATGGSFTLLLAKACALTLREQPDFNAAWTRDGVARRDRVDVAIAMEAENGLLTPVLRDVAGRPLAELAAEWRAVKERIRQHRMAPEAYRGASFYLSNLGMYPGVVQFDAIVPPGATAILAVAAPGAQGTVVTLTCDHRVVFGADAARFLQSLAARLADPANWAT